MTFDQTADVEHRAMVLLAEIRNREAMLMRILGCRTVAAARRKGAAIERRVEEPLPHP